MSIIRPDTGNESRLSGWIPYRVFDQKCSYLYVVNQLNTVLLNWRPAVVLWYFPQRWVFSCWIITSDDWDLNQGSLMSEATVPSTAPQPPPPNDNHTIDDSNTSFGSRIMMIVNPFRLQKMVSLLFLSDGTNLHQKSQWDDKVHWPNNERRVSHKQQRINPARPCC